MKTNCRYVCGLLVVWGLLATGLSATDDARASKLQLAGSEWGIEFIEGGKGRDGIEPFVQFAGEGIIRGNSGCNKFSGTYSLNGYMLEVSPLVSSKDICLNDGMDLEYRFLTALESSHRVDGDHLKLELFNSQGRLLLTLTRRDWD